MVLVLRLSYVNDIQGEFFKTDTLYFFKPEKGINEIITGMLLSRRVNLLTCSTSKITPNLKEILIKIKSYFRKPQKLYFYLELELRKYLEPSVKFKQTKETCNMN